LSVFVDRASQSRARCLNLGERSYRDLVLDTGDAPKVLLHERRFPCLLSIVGHVLQITASASSGMRVATRRRDAFGARFEYLHRVTAIKLGRGLGDRHPDKFTGQRVTHEGDPPILRATNGAARRRTFDSNREKTVVR
jgi:hypothetical protein